jgi:hypothetical protein
MANFHILKRVRSFLSLLGRKRILLILLILAIAFALRVIWIDAPVVRDEADGGYISMIWLRGYSLYSYSDATRPPLFYAFYAVSNLFSSPNVLLIRLMADTIFWISVVFFYLLVRDRFGLKEAVVATLLYSIFMNVPIFEGMVAIPESIVTPLLVISLSACNMYFKNGHKSWLMASGFICAGAYLILQNQLLGIIVVFLFILETKALRAKDRKSCLRDIAIVGVSFAIPILLTVPMFFFSGEVHDLIRVLLAERPLSNYSYVSILPVDVEVLKILEGLPLWFFGAIGTFGILKRRSLALPLSWSAIMLALAEIPPDFPHRFLGLIPPAAILSSIGLLSSARALKKWTRKANPVVALLLVILMFPPLLFTAVQYPTTNISWAGFGWNNTWVPSSSDQMAIARFIVSESINGSVLIHGWLPELYWLSGKMAPSLYVYTWNEPGRSFESIPPNEYEKIVSEIKEERFEMILFPTWLGSDEIINTTENTYVLTNIIYNFYVYEAHPIEEGVNYSFIAEFHNAQAYALLPNGNQMPIAEMNNTVVIPRLESLTVNNKTQYAIFQHPLLIQSNITYSNIQIPVNATLEFSIAIDPRVWNKTGDGVQFEIAINSNGQSNEIFSNYINPKANLEDRKWFFYSIPLNEYANKVVSISFITNPGPVGDSNWDWAYWGNPLIR